MAELTDKQQRFVDEYLVDFNATHQVSRIEASWYNNKKRRGPIRGHRSTRTNRTLLVGD